MASRQELEQALLETLSEVLAEQFDTSTEEMYSHVGVESRATSLDLPGFTFEVFETDEGHGMHGNPHPEHITIDREGGVAHVTYSRRKEATLDIIAHSADGDRRGVNRLYGAAERRFNTFEHRHPSSATLHEHVDHAELDVQGTQDVSQPEDDVRGDRLRVVVPYYRYYEVAPPLIEEVDNAIEMGDKKTVLEWAVEMNDEE